MKTVVICEYEENHLLWAILWYTEKHVREIWISKKDLVKMEKKKVLYLKEMDVSLRRLHSGVCFSDFLWSDNTMGQTGTQYLLWKRVMIAGSKREHVTLQSNSTDGCRWLKMSLQRWAELSPNGGGWRDLDWTVPLSNWAGLKCSGFQMKTRLKQW